MRFTYCPHCGKKLIKEEMLMLGFKSKIKKADFVLSQEVDFAKWFKFKEALGNIREGSIAWQLVKAVIEG